MPNWVYNKLTVEGTKEDLDRLQEYVSDGTSEFSFDKIIPVPDTMFPEKHDGYVVSGNSSLQLYCFLSEKGTKTVPAEKMEKYFSNEAQLTELSQEEKDELFRENAETFEAQLAELSQEEKDDLSRIGEVKAANIDAYGVCDWYEFCIAYWGTKWPAREVASCRKSDTRIDYDFNTAWSIPAGIYGKLTKEFPDVRFTLLYADDDLGYNCGFLQVGGGKRNVSWPDEKTSEDTLRLFAEYLWTGTVEGRYYDEDEDEAEDEVTDEEFLESIPKRMRKYLKGE